MTNGPEKRICRICKKPCWGYRCKKCTDNKPGTRVTAMRRRRIKRLKKE